jgi:sugar phosphate isomerase/epimerase
VTPSMWTSYLIEWLPDDMVREFSRHGWHTCELSDEHGHDLLKQGDPATVGARLKAFAADYGVRFPQGHFYLCTKGFRPEDREGRRVADIAPADDAEFARAQEDMRRWIDLFSALGVEAGVLHLGGGDLAAAGWSEDCIFARRCDALSRLAEYARGGGTVLCLENLGAGSGVRTIDDIEAVLNAVNAPNVGICLDTGHANLNGVNNADFIRRAGPRLLALHVADNLGQHDDHLLPYGRGTICWSEVMEALREVRYRGLFNFEVPGENHCPPAVRLAKLDYALALAGCMLAPPAQE